MQFYTEPIVPLRIPQTSERLDPPLIDVYVPHGSKSRGQINASEAEAIVDEIEKIVEDPAYKGRSIGIVSLIGPKQAHHIQAQLLSRIGEEAYLEHNITCGNPATFQGKERDIMLVSMVECPQTQSAKTALLWQQRFNVAFSRARDRMYLFRSVDDKDLKPDDLKALAIRHFDSPMETAVPVVDDLIELCESDFERDVFSRLRTLGYRVTPQVRVAGYSIDMVVEGAHDRRLAVELDGDQYHTPEQWTDDLVRQRTLERMGWRFWRCWGSSYYLDSDACINDLARALKSLGIEPLGSKVPRNIYTEHRVVEAPEAKTPETPEAERTEEGLELPLVELPTIAAAATEPSREQEEAGVVATIETAPSAVSSNVLETSAQTIEVGDRVLIAYNDEPGRQHTIRISATEHDPDMEIIRAGHPLAEALLGAEIDEELEIPAGGGKRTITVVGIEKDTSSLPVQATDTKPPLVQPGNARQDPARTLSAAPESPAPPESDPSLTPSETPDQPEPALPFAQVESAGKANEPLSIRNETPAPRSHAARNQTAQPYQAWSQQPLPNPREEPVHKVAHRLIDIVEAEGPIILQRAFHLYAHAAGIGRIGQQLRSAFLQAAAIAIQSQRIEAEQEDRDSKVGLESVVRPAGCPPVILRTRGPRSFEEIPPSEVKQLLRSFLTSRPGIDQETLYRQVLEFFELKRLTSNVRNSLNRFVAEEGLKISSSETPDSPEPDSNSATKYDFDLLGERYSANTLGDVLVSVLQAFHEIDNSFLSRFAREVGRTRPMLARDPTDLYPGRADLARYSREVANGWYVGTNYSKRDVARILGGACEIAGLVPGQDLKGPIIDEIGANLPNSNGPLPHGS